MAANAFKLFDVRQKIQRQHVLFTEQSCVVVHVSIRVGSVFAIIEWHVWFLEISAHDRPFTKRIMKMSTKRTTNVRRRVEYWLIVVRCQSQCNLQCNCLAFATQALTTITRRTRQTTHFLYKFTYLRQVQKVRVGRGVRRWWSHLIAFRLYRRSTSQRSEIGDRNRILCQIRCFDEHHLYCATRCS